MQQYGNKNSKIWRHLTQFRLRSFLAIVLVLGMLLGTVFHRVNSQRRAVRWVESHGGRCLYDFHWHGKNAFGKQMPPRWVTDLVGVDFFANVYKVDLNDCKLDSLKPLAALPNLKRLYLRNSTILDLHFVDQHKQLIDLCITGTKVEDISPLTQLHELIFIQMLDTQVTDVRPLTNLKHLHRVTLPNNIDDSQIELLKHELPDCEFCTFKGGYLIQY